VAIIGAYQVTSFRTVDQYSYNSTFMTGNLRMAVDGIYKAMHKETRRDGARKARELSPIVVSFLAGAAAGATLAPRMLNHTLWVIELPLLSVLVIVLRRRYRTTASGGHS